MSIRTGFSTKPLDEAVADLKIQCGEGAPAFVICFASSKYDPVRLSQAMQQAFPDSHVIGCTTAGEIVSGRMLSDSVVAMFLDSEIVEHAAVSVVANVSAHPELTALAELEAQLGAPLGALDIDRHAGIVLVDGLSGAEEWLMEQLGDRTDLPFVGGSAGDDLKFQCTSLWADGKCCHNAAVLAVLRLPNGFDVIKTQSFRPTGKTLVATRVNESCRQVIEFNGQPALAAYCEALGIAPEAAPGRFMRNPLGLMIHGEPFVRSPQRVQDNTIFFYCRIREGMELRILDATDIVADTRSAIEDYRASRPRVAGFIDFHCILRTLELRADNDCDRYGAIYEDIPAVGFSTYGEQYLGHINQTSTILAIR